jgi:predicted nucleic acid-binding protein
MPGNFFDSNVLLYLQSGDPWKAERAEKALRDGGAISVQVLNEIASVSLRKFRLSWPETRRMLETLRDLLTIHPIDVETHELGLSIGQRHQLNIYDAMILAAAIQANCDQVWSEDMQDGLVVNRTLTVFNPFRR